MRPKKLKTKIFLDSADPGETRETIRVLGFLDGQTTNPTLISRNSEIKKMLAENRKFTKDGVYDFYKTAVKEISQLIPHGSVSAEVYADEYTTAREMLEQARMINTWSNNINVKLPLTKEGLKACRLALKEGIRINMTLCFNQEQAAAVYAATRGIGPGNVFVSPFVGRLDDVGEYGLDLVTNMVRMFKHGRGRVKVLAASIRNLDQFLCAIKAGTDIITAPPKLLREWGQEGFRMPSTDLSHNITELKRIPYRDLDLEKEWHQFNICHELTATGMRLFSEDWNKLIA